LVATGFAGVGLVVAGLVVAGWVAADFAAGFAGSVFTAASAGCGDDVGDAMATPAISSSAGAAAARRATARHAEKRRERVSGMSLSLFDGGLARPDSQGYSTQG
jgi:hypothetical protein